MTVQHAAWPGMGASDRHLDGQVTAIRALPNGERPLGGHVFLLSSLSNQPAVFAIISIAAGTSGKRRDCASAKWHW